MLRTGWASAAAVPVAVAAAVLLAGCGQAGPARNASPGRPPGRPAATAGQAGPAGASPGASAGPGKVGPGPAAGTGPPAAAAAGWSRPRTSCRSVVHIGDSTSDGLVLPAYQPDAALRIAARYREVGVTRFIPEVSGARSIVETWHGFANAYTVAQRLIRAGYHGCWVLALGTNDTADVAVGSAVGLATRIWRMMSLIGGQPVLWINLRSLPHSGPYAESRMQQWNRALLRACPSYPSMRVYDWAAVARSGWFIPDGIHYTPQGYAQRARLIASALARAFPAGRPPPPGLVRPELTGQRGAAGSGCLVR